MGGGYYLWSILRGGGVQFGMFTSKMSQLGKNMSPWCFCLKFPIKVEIPCFKTGRLKMPDLGQKSWISVIDIKNDSFGVKLLYFSCLGEIWLRLGRKSWIWDIWVETLRLGRKSWTLYVLVKIPPFEQKPLIWGGWVKNAPFETENPELAAFRSKMSDLRLKFWISGA